MYINICFGSMRCLVKPINEDNSENIGLQNTLSVNLSSKNIKLIHLIFAKVVKL